VTASLGPLQFGLNLSTLNPCTDIIKSFIRNDTFLFKQYYEKRDLFAMMEGKFKVLFSIYRYPILFFYEKKDT
jgi:hypothetical protein